MPLGPEIEYTGEKHDAPIEIRVYRGADGTFNLYEDTGDSYDYQKVQHSIIPLRWDERAGQLTVGAREGSFPGMVQQRIFRVVFVGKGHGAGPTETASVDREVTYNGQAVTVSAH